ncbi:MAG: Rne/Rng family ribonuclease [Desulfoarculaceae bacterium]|nr:Rne/Rng family ribonuclease [Desulfoarculaceae bacterium]
MTVKKTSPEKAAAQEQGDKKGKATTGSWWKSTVADESGREGAGQEQPSPPEVVAESGMPEKKPAGRPARPRRKKTDVVPDVIVPDPGAQAGEQSVADGEKAASGQDKTAVEESVAAVSDSKKKPAGRPARPRRKKIDVVPDVVESGPGPQAGDQLPVEGEQAASGQNEESGEEDAAETSAPQKKSGRRPARPRRKKTEAVMPVGEIATEGTDGVVPGDASQGLAASETVADKLVSPAPTGEKPKRSSRSRGRRKPAPGNLDIQDEEDDNVPDVEDEKAKTTISRLLINAEEPEECRIAMLEDGRLESLHVSTISREHTKSNIYKARIVAVESNLQAAFVDYGTEKNGFLPFSEIHPEYYRHDVSEKTMKLIEQHQWKNLNINEVLERGQELLVQVVKEEVGNKGANMTTYLSLPGRCVVLMPGSDSSGVSKKISGDDRRSQLRDIMDSLEIPEGIGWIVRTASFDLTEISLAKDVKYLLKLWGEIKSKGQAMIGVGLVYQDQDCVLRFLREHFDPEIKEILVDDLAAMEKVRDFIDLLPDEQKHTKVRLHKGARPIFNQYNVEDQIESIYQPQVFLPSGGSIVIDPTEALVAIDVNSGSTGKGQNFEDAIFLANVEAATELARQLRLRDLGGLIVVDFIDMRSQKNIREVERQVKVAMKRDKAKVDISRISKFGLMQISRQKLGAPVEALNYQVCPHCMGRGVVRSVETLALFYLRRMQTGASRKMVDRVECRFPLDVAHYLLNNKRHELIDLENRHKISVEIIADPALKPADHEINFHKEERDRQVKEGSRKPELER